MSRIIRCDRCHKVEDSGYCLEIESWNTRLSPLGDGYACDLCDDCAERIFAFLRPEDQESQQVKH